MHFFICRLLNKYFYQMSKDLLLYQIVNLRKFCKIYHTFTNILFIKKNYYKLLTNLNLWKYTSFPKLL